MIKNRPHRLDLIYIDRPLFFVTFCTRNRRKIPSLDCAKTTLENYGRSASEKFNTGLDRYVIMPDHIHLFVRGDPEFSLSRWVGGLKRAISVEVVCSGGPEGFRGGKSDSRQLWQPGFFDHVLRSDESYAEKWNYVRQNPVRAGLVARAEEWPYQGEVVYIDRA
jgi:putative transposase